MDEQLMKFGSVCSGVEAASVAWLPLGWTAVWLAEIEPFPSALLAQRFPETLNLGDMTELPAKVRAGELEAPDILVGGTPCQSFSIAGLRGGLEDPRGLLTMKYVELLNEIDKIRTDRGDSPAIAVWENVPGVLSDKDNAFGCFLAALAGEDSELQPTGERWSNAGCVYGPQRAVAWRVLDAQHFGVAQRRRRVFVVATARNGADPARILFEWEGVRRDSAPSREAETTSAENVTPSTAVTGGSQGVVVKGYRMVAFGEYAEDDTASTMKARDYKDHTDLVVATRGTQTTIRRLTPTECERLQGFPDSWTKIEWRGKPAEECPNGHRYKALGNSMAVPVMRWIGERISTTRRETGESK